MNLKKLRTQENKSQYEVSQTLNIPLRSYQEYESGRSQMKYNTLIKLADYFGCSIDYLLGHQTANTLQLDGLREEQKQIINLAIRMDEKQATFALGQLSIIMKLPDTQIAPARPF